MKLDDAAEGGPNNFNVPALIVSLLFTAAVLGPLLTTVPVSDDLQDVKTKH